MNFLKKNGLKLLLAIAIGALSYAQEERRETEIKESIKKELKEEGEGKAE